MDTSQVIPALINKAYNLKNNERLEVWGDGKQARSFINSFDIANSLLTMIKSKKSLNKYDSVQLGDRVGTTIEELSKMILSELGKDESLITYINPDYRGDVGRVPDQILAKKLGLEQQIGIREGLRELIQWAKENGKI